MHKSIACGKPRMIHFHAGFTETDRKTRQPADIEEFPGNLNKL